MTWYKRSCRHYKPNLTIACMHMGTCRMQFALLDAALRCVCVLHAVVEGHHVDPCSIILITCIYSFHHSLETLFGDRILSLYCSIQV